MTGNPLIEIQKYGQSIWMDFISRGLITSGKMQKLVERGIAGMTSNPTIFAKAIADGHDYDDTIKTLLDLDAEAIYEKLTVADIRAAAEVLLSSTTARTARTVTSASKSRRCWRTTPRRRPARPSACSLRSVARTSDQDPRHAGRAGCYRGGALRRGNINITCCSRSRTICRWSSGISARWSAGWTKGWTWRRSRRWRASSSADRYRRG